MILWSSIVCLIIVGATASIPQKNQNIMIIKTMVIMTVVSCWLMWLITYMAQMNPLITPELDFEM